MVDKEPEIWLMSCFCIHLMKLQMIFDGAWNLLDGLREVIICASNLLHRVVLRLICIRMRMYLEQSRKKNHNTVANIYFDES